MENKISLNAKFFLIAFLIILLYVGIFKSSKDNKMINPDYYIIKTNQTSGHLNKDLPAIFSQNNLTNPERIEYGITKRIKIHSLKPLVFTIDKFLTDHECQHFINISKNRKFHRGKVHSNNGNVEDTARTNGLMWINHKNDSITDRITQKISSLINTPIENAEAIDPSKRDK